MDPHGFATYRVFRMPFEPHPSPVRLPLRKLGSVRPHAFTRLAPALTTFASPPGPLGLRQRMHRRIDLFGGTAVSIA